MMKKAVLVVFGAALLVSTGLVGAAGAGVNLNIGIGLGTPAVVYPAPPPMAFPAPPDVVVIPGTYVYYVPDVDVNIFFYHGFWWRPYEGRWYRSPYYRGPWMFTAPRRVPRPLVMLPPGWRGRPARYGRIPYGRLRGHWRRWERERHWDRDERGRREHDRGWHRGMGRGDDD
ncbi:MAG: hypothetical protein M0033_04340 [Nitrospiraceae bacterium]|nr:hypothetical protein [Nitrospiraceae bacterium]